jgi:4-hydroxybenzoate polyprenyltransferase
MPWTRLRLTLDMIKFEHSIFALPFALTGALLAFREGGYPSGGIAQSTAWSTAWSTGRSTAWTMAWIVVAMVAARSAAMAFNRLVDTAIDARNPRTRTRHLPVGLLSKGFAWAFVAATSAVFFVAAAALNPLCLKLAPVALGIVFFYSFTKRFTSFSHLVLGFSLGVAPAAAWIAVRGSLDPRILWLTAAVTFWTAGFDVIYACQDFAFDTAEGLFSVPRAIGIAGALRAAMALHVLMIACLLALVYTLHMGALALAGVASIVALLAYEHSLVKAEDLSRVNAAFFTMNGYVSVLFFIFWAADILLLKPGA